MSVAQGASRLSPARWAQPDRAGPGGKTFSPGNREEHSEAAAVPVRGAEDRAMDTCHTCTILLLVQAPPLTGGKLRHTEKEGFDQSHRSPDPLIRFLPHRSCHSQMKRFAFILLDCTRFTRKAGCNEAPT